MSTQISTLNVKLTATASAFSSTMQAASKHVGALGKQVKAVGEKIFSFGGALTALAAGGSMAYLVKQSMESIDATAKLSDRLGITTEAMVGLQHQADLSGVSSEQLTAALDKMLKTLGDAATKGGIGAAALANLGLTAEQLASLSPDQAFAEIAQGLTDIHNPALRAQTAMALFGDAGAKLLPMMLQGKEGIAAATEEARKLGLTFSRTDAAKIEAANGALTNMGNVFTGIAQTLAIQLAPFIEAAANKMTELGTSGEGMGSRVVNAFEFVLKAIAYGANVIDGFKIVLKSLQIAFAWTFSKEVEIVLAFAKAVAAVVNGAIDGINWMIEKANKVPGVNIPPIETKLMVDDTTAKAVIEDQQKLMGELATDISNLSKFDNADKVTTYFNNLRSAADQNAKAIADNAKAMNTGKYAINDWAEKLKEAEAKAKKITETIDGMQKDVSRFGLSEGQGKLLDLEQLGASPDQLAKAKELIDLKSQFDAIGKIDTGDPVTDFAAKMEQLQNLYAAGKVTLDQFTAIKQTAKATLDDKLKDDAKSITDCVKTPLEQYAEQLDKLNLLLDKKLITQDLFDRASLKAQQTLNAGNGQPPPLATALKAGSADAMKIAFDNAKGVQRLSKEQLTEKQYAEQKKSSDLLDRIERNTRTGVDVEEVNL